MEATTAMTSYNSLYSIRPNFSWSGEWFFGWDSLSFLGIGTFSCGPLWFSVTWPIGDDVVTLGERVDAMKDWTLDVVEERVLPALGRLAQPLRIAGYAPSMSWARSWRMRG